MRRSNIDNPWNEITALQIISLIDSEYFPSFINAIEDDQYICVVSEYVQGGIYLHFIFIFAIVYLLIYHIINKTVDLFDKIKKSRNGLELDKAQKYLIQISHAVRQLHDNNLAHLDLSSENILIDKNDNIKIIDFGVCSEIIDKNKEEKQTIYHDTNATDSDQDIEEKQKKDANLTYNKHIRSRLLPGKPGYRSPEIETRKECDPKLADAFSFGYIAWTILNGNMPFETAHPNDQTYQKFMEYGAKKWIEMLSTNINGWDNNIKDNENKEIPENAINLLDDLLKCNTFKRKSIEDLLNDKTSFLCYENDEKKSEEKRQSVDIDRKPKMLGVNASSSMEIDQQLIGLNFQLSH